MRNASLSRPADPPYGACCAAFSPVQGDPSMPLSPLRFGFAGQGRQIGSQFFVSWFRMFKAMFHYG
jgi:hypothetical protein